MARYVTERPALKYTFFGGKGGVGKTAMAGATALWLAKQGKRTLLASTNPVHSLSGLLGQNVAERHTPVTGVDRFWAYEIDTRDTIERSKREIREKIQWFLKFADISTKADDFVESATMNPAFEESAMFENMVDLMLEDDYDVCTYSTPLPRRMREDCWACPKSTRCGWTRCSSRGKRHEASARCFRLAKRKKRIRCSHTCCNSANAWDRRNNG